MAEPARLSGRKLAAVPSDELRLSDTPVIEFELRDIGVVLLDQDPERDSSRLVDCAVANGVVPVRTGVTKPASELDFAPLIVELLDSDRFALLFAVDVEREITGVTAAAPAVTTELC